MDYPTNMSAVRAVARYLTGLLDPHSPSEAPRGS